MMEHFVYIIHSEFYNIYYIGHTYNLEDRLMRHNNNRSKFTKNKDPWKLIISYQCKSKSEAYQPELKLKAMKNSSKAIEYLKKLGGIFSIYEVQYEAHHVFQAALNV